MSTQVSVHQTSTTSTVGNEFVLTCTCGIQFIGDVAGIKRNMAYHQDETARTAVVQRAVREPDQH